MAKEKATRSTRHTRGKAEARAENPPAELQRENESLRQQVAEHQQIAEALASEKYKLQALVDGLGRTHIGINIVGIDHRIHFQNQVLRDMFGDLIGQTCYEKYMGRQGACDDCPVTRAIRHNQLEIQKLVHPGGRTYRVLSAPFLNPDGSTDKAIEVIIDITEGKQAEEKLQESEQLFRSIVENSHGGIFVVDDAYRFTYTNDMLCSILGYHREEILGCDFRDFLDEDSRKLVADRYVRRQRGEDIPSRYEFNIVRKAGDKRRVELSSTVIRDARDRLRTVGQLLDITERVRTEEALRESERKFSGIAENIPGVVFQFRVRKDGTSYFSYISPRAPELLDLSTDPDSPDWNLQLGPRVHQDDREEFLRSVGQAVVTRSRWNYEGRMVTAGGGLRWFQGISSPTEIDNELVFDGVLLDITKRKTAEEALRQATEELERRVEERTAELQEANARLQQEIVHREEIQEALRLGKAKYHDLVENANSIILEMDTQGNVTFFNRFAQEFFGFSEAEILGHNVVGTIVPPTDSSGKDLRIRIEDIVQHPEKYYNSENENMRRNGERVWVAWTNQGIYDKNGRLSEILCTGIDRTEQKRAAELLAQQAQERVAAAERQRLARDLHDAVTQTLFSASLIAEVLPRLWQKDRAEGERRLEELRQLTRGALAEMRMLLLELRPAALSEVGLPELLRQLAEATTGRARLPVSLTVEGQCTVPADVQVALFRIAQEALNNIVKHARATEAKLHIHCEEHSTELTISDDGSGFDVNTASPEHLGLRIMRERAEDAGARLAVESQIGRGTKVTILWPDPERKEPL